MDDFFDLPTLIVIGLAIVILFRLRSVLGTRTGNERNPLERRAAAKNRLAVTARTRWCRRSASVRRLSLATDEARQIDLHRAAFARLAVDRHVAARLLDETVHHGKPETGPSTERLRGEERFECLADHVGRHADAGIADGEQHVLPGSDLGVRGGIAIVEISIRRLDRQPAAVRHRVARVDREVEQHVLELVGIDARLPQAAGEHGLDRDVLAQGPAQQVRHAGHQSPDIERLRLQRLLAGEGEQPMRQRCGALHAGHRRFGEPTERGAVRRQPSLQQLDVAADHRQMVVEIVRDAAGETADRLHLLRLAQRLFGHFAPAHLAPAVAPACSVADATAASPAD